MSGCVDVVRLLVMAIRADCESDAMMLLCRCFSSMDLYAACMAYSSAVKMDVLFGNRARAITSVVLCGVTRMAPIPVLVSVCLEPSV